MRHGANRRAPPRLVRWAPAPARRSLRATAKTLPEASSLWCSPIVYSGRCAIISAMRSLAWPLAALIPGFLFAQKKPFDADALLQIQRIADPQLSPDGKTVAFAVGTPDVPNNKTLHSVWSVPLAGGEARKLADLADRPRWSPDGKRIFYTGTSS